MKLENDGFNLILSGGAALGYAHIGVYEYLYQHHLTPKSFHGVSMGAIVSAVLALDEINHKEKMQLFKIFKNILRWLLPSLSGSLINTKRIYKILNEIFHNKKFSDLKKDLNIIATEYQSGELTIFNKQNDIYIKDALLASMAIPAVFPPHKIEDKFYVDGYISSNLPLQSIQNDLPNLVVNVTGKYSFKKLHNTQIEDLSILENLERSIRILIYNQTKCNLEKFNKPYILIEPHLTNYKTYHFKKYKQIKKAGYDAIKSVFLKNDF